MYSVTKVIHFCYGHRLLNYEGKCRHPHGHNGKIEITLSSRKLNSLGMVMDFEEIKSKIQKWVDSELDHRMILNRKDPLAGVLKELGEPVYLLEENPTAEAISRLIFRYAESQGLAVSEVKLWETVQSFASYHEG